MAVVDANSCSVFMETFNQLQRNIIVRMASQYHVFNAILYSSQATASNLSQTSQVILSAALC